MPELTEHLNSTYTMKLTYEEESYLSLPGHTCDMKGRRNSETPTVSEEDAHIPISALHFSPSVISETGGHQNVTG